MVFHFGMLKIWTIETVFHLNIISCGYSILSYCFFHFFELCLSYYGCIWFNLHLAMIWAIFIF